MSLENLKLLEHDTLVEFILSKYLGYNPESVLQCLVEDDDLFGLVDYWAELNSTDKLCILDAIEMSLHDVADFNVISTSLCQDVNTCHSLLRLQVNLY